MSKDISLITDKKFDKILFIFHARQLLRKNDHDHIKIDVIYNCYKQIIRFQRSKFENTLVNDILYQGLYGIIKSLKESSNQQQDKERENIEMEMYEMFKRNDMNLIFGFIRENIESEYRLNIADEIKKLIFNIHDRMILFEDTDKIDNKTKWGQWYVVTNEYSVFDLEIF